MTDWRGLLDSIRRPWRDRGRNTSRKNVNICCPWCRDDDGFHLGISEDKDAYYCFRRPEHSGTNLIALLTQLGQPRVESFRLLNEFRGEQRVLVERPVIAPGKAATAWTRFYPAIDAQRVLDYIQGRGFDEPRAVAQRYDIRFADGGTWAWRMLLPFTQDGRVVSWTGRALADRFAPKYLNFESGMDGLVYAPRAGRDLVIVVEGPLDALKLAAAGEQLPVAAVALTGKQLNAARMWNLRQAIGSASRVSLCLDADTSLAESSRMMAELRGGLPGIQVNKLKLPGGFKDAGGMPWHAAKQWLQQLV